MYNKWDIILVSLPFRARPKESKTRPCVIIDVDNVLKEYIIVGITSVPHWRKTDYNVKYCRQANLSDGSIIMTDHIVRVRADKNFTYVGRLDKYDRRNVICLLLPAHK